MDDAARGSRTLLVTGGAGFIGGHFVRAVRRAGAARVINLDSLTYAADLDGLAALDGDPGHTFVRGDVRDGALVARLLAEHRPAAIVHLAAESHVDRSIDGPAIFVETNVVGTHALLAAARAYLAALPAAEADAFRFVHVSTDEVYGSLGPGDPCFDERSPYAPSSPYAASKAAADHLVRAYHATYGLPAIVTHCTNNYGPRQLPEKLLPLVIRNALDGLPLPVYGDGRQVRDWLHVEDHVEALRRVLDRGRPGETYDVGAGGARTNLEVVHAVCDLLDELAPPPPAGPRSYRDLVRLVADRPGHDRRYGIDAAKIRRELGWAPARGFEDGLRETVRWYLDHRGWRAGDGADGTRARRGLAGQAA